MSPTCQKAGKASGSSVSLEAFGLYSAVFRRSPWTWHAHCSVIEITTTAALPSRAELSDWEDCKQTTSNSRRNKMPNWYIVSSSNPTLAIQGGAQGGSGVTLQTLDTSNPLQQWTPQFQTAMVNGVPSNAGIAILNASTGLSVTLNGTSQQLVMQSYSPQSTDQDSWLMVQGGGTNAFRLTWPNNQSWSWNDYLGKFQPGDSIYLWNDTGANSVWSLSYQ
jgi:hypothetical protein